MTLQLKNLVSILLTVVCGFCSSWSASSWYANGRYWWLWLMLSLTSLLAQVLLAFTKTREENLFELFNELNMQKTRQKISESKAISDAIEKEIAAGNLKKAKDWMKIRDKI
jgi:hypothetical protein